jgi:predicted small integral membrane protein
MPPVSYLFRLAKTLCVGSIGLMMLIIVIGNTTDYFSNYQFVEHVLKMDSIFPDSQLHYRSLNSPILSNTTYIAIIITEALASFCCIRGFLFLFKNLKSDAVSFHASKNWAVAGLILGILLWFLGFEVIGGEWFAMWQSARYNGLAAAERVLIFLMLTLILLQIRDE